MEALERVSNLNARRTAGELKRESAATDASGIDPERLCSAGEDVGYRVKLSWAGCRTDGSYDAVFSRMDAAAEEWKPVNRPQQSTKGGELAKYANVPGQNIFREGLLRQLLCYCKRKLARGTGSSRRGIGRRSALRRKCGVEPTRPALPWRRRVMNRSARAVAQGKTRKPG